MTQPPGVYVEGLATLTRTMRQAGVDISELKDASKAAGDIVTAAASALAPRRSGRLASSVRPSKLAAGVRVSVGKASVPYAGPIHWGWPARGITAQPFISNAATQTEPMWTAAYRKDVEAALAKVRGA